MKARTSTPVAAGLLRCVAVRSAAVKGRSLGGREEDVKLIEALRENKGVHEGEFKDQRKREPLSPSDNPLGKILLLLLPLVY